MGKPIKQYRAGMKKPASAGGSTVQSGTRQGIPSKTQNGKNHKNKGLRVNHNRSR